MKNEHLTKKINSTLSCNLKCLRFLPMIHKKIIFGLFILSFLGACGAPTAMLGPAYTFSSSGSVLQAGFSYGSSEMITAYTGKTPLENMVEISSINDHNIHKKTIVSKDFQNLVKKRVEKTNSILNSTNQ